MPDDPAEAAMFDDVMDDDSGVATAAVAVRVGSIMHGRARYGKEWRDVYADAYGVLVAPDGCDEFVVAAS